MPSKSKRPPQFTNPPPSDSSSDDEEVHPTPQPSEKPKPIKSKPQPPEEEPDEEDDEDESEDEDGDEDEKEEKKSSPLPLTQKQQQTTQKNPKEDSSSDEDDEEDEEDESDSSDEDEEKNQKGSEKPKPGERIEPVVPVPIRSKSMNSKPAAKPRQVGQGNQSKKRPVSPVAAEKVPRIWSEEDEIVLLEGVLEFQRKNGVSVSSDPGMFHETVKDKFSMSVDKTQLKEKLRRLKDKYNRMKGSEGKSPDVSKPHDGRCFELFNRIWGDGDVVGNNNGDGSENVKKKTVSAASPGKSGKKGSANGSNAVVGMKATGVGNGGNVSRDGEDVLPREYRPELTELYPHLMRALKSREGIVGSGVVLSSIGVLGESELKGLDDRWKKMRKTELQLYMKEMDRRKEETDLLKEQANLERHKRTMMRKILEARALEQNPQESWTAQAGCCYDFNFCGKCLGFCVKDSDQYCVIQSTLYRLITWTLLMFKALDYIMSLIAC
ncbi:STOREKEEPER protein-like protein [Drosera capensis]